MLVVYQTAVAFQLMAFCGFSQGLTLLSVLTPRKVIKNNRLNKGYFEVLGC